MLIKSELYIKKMTMGKHPYISTSHLETGQYVWFSKIAV